MSKKIMNFCYLPASFARTTRITKHYEFQITSGRFHPKARSLTILPTLNCNLSCKYCFEEAHRRIEKMSPEIVKKLKQYIKEQYVHGRRTEYMDLHWFGGEPLLGFDITAWPNVSIPIWWVPKANCICVCRTSAIQRQ